MSSIVKKQSVAVIFTDIAEYTDIMISDEEKVLSLLEEKADNLEPDVKLKFLNYPILNAIV